MNEEFEFIADRAELELNSESTFLQKFGELVVQECLDILNEMKPKEVHTEWEHGYSKALDKATHRIIGKFL